jgi:hypothetical protein
VRFLAALSIAILTTAAHASPTLARGGGRGGGGLVSVSGYTRANGTHVAPHVRTRPDGILENNLSYRGGAYRSPEPALVANAGPTSGPRITSAGPQAIPGPTTWTDTGPRLKEPWCTSKRVVGTGAGFCMVN